MLNPIRQLKGKLNHLKVPNNHIYKIIQLANSLPQKISQSQSQFSKATIDELKSLKSESSNLSTKAFYKFMFELTCHQLNCNNAVPNSIFEELIPQEQKVSAHYQSYLKKLNSKQLAYLNLKIRKRINSQIPTLQNLHINNDSPSKRDILLVPTLSRVSTQAELKSLPKKGVSAIVKTFHGEE